MGSILLYWLLLIMLVVTYIKQGLQTPISLSSSKETVLENSSVALTSYNKTGLLSESRWKSSMQNELATCVRLENECKKTRFLNNNDVMDCSCDDDGTYTVTIKHVDRYQHESRWRCVPRSIESNTVVINVSVPVTDAILTQSGNESIYENTSVTFTCTTSYSLPSAQMHWYRSYRSSNVEITDSQDVNIKRETHTREDNVIRVTEIISYRVNRSVNGWSVYCTATNWQNNVVTSDKIELSVIYPPDILPVIDGFPNGSTYKVIENERVNLSCSVKGGNPLAKPEWHCERINNITSIKRITDNGTVTSYISWMAIRADGKTCTCQTGHVLSNVSIFINIDVSYRASVKQFVVHGHEQDVHVMTTESTYITFICKIDSNPNSTVKIITPNGIEVVSTGKNVFMYSHFLSSCVDNGTYTCSGSNDYNYGHPGLAELPVFVKCTPMPFLHTDIRSKLFVPVTLQFRTVAYPEPEFTWEKWTNGSWKQLTNGSMFSISHYKLQAYLTVVNFTSTTAEIYRLIVKNEIGALIHNYKLKPAERPGTPKELRHMEELLTDTSLTLLWKPGFNGGIAQSFIITYTDEKGHDLKNIVIQDAGNTVMNVTVNGLSSDTRYTIQLIAVNSVGISEEVTLRVKTKGYPEGTDTKLPIIGIVLGVISLLVLAIAIALFVFLRRRYQKKGDSGKKKGSYDNLTEMATISGEKPEPVYEGLTLDTESGADKRMEQAYDILKLEQERTPSNGEGTVPEEWQAEKGLDGATSQTYTNLKL